MKVIEEFQDRCVYMEVGFSFITAHSEQLFNPKKEATLKDVALNPEAACMTSLLLCSQD